jgi:hypothetical protein
MNLANALHDLWEMVPRLGSICNPSMPTAAIINAAAAAAGAAIKRSGSGAAPPAPGSGGGGGGAPGGSGGQPQPAHPQLQGGRPGRGARGASETHTPSMSSSGHAFLESRDPLAAAAGAAAAGLKAEEGGPAGAEGGAHASGAPRARRVALGVRRGGGRGPLGAFSWDLSSGGEDAGGRPGGAPRAGPGPAAARGGAYGAPGAARSSSAAGGSEPAPSLLAAMDALDEGEGLPEDGELLSSLKGVLDEEDDPM